MTGMTKNKPQGPRPGQRICLKRKKRHGHTYATAALARKEVREYYAETGERMYLYYCADYPCSLHRYIHWTVRYPSSKRNRGINQKLINFYLDDERTGTGTSKQRARERRDRRKFVHKQMPFLTWEGEGGALHPRDLEDA